MTAQVVVSDGWRLTTASHIDGCCIEAEGSLERSLTTTALAEGGSCTAVVELVAFRGGIQPTALLAAAFTARAEPLQPKLHVELLHSGELTLGEAPSCQTRSAGLLVAGLPFAFAVPALDGFSSAAPPIEVPGGVCINGAAYHEVYSSSLVFERAGGLLRYAIAQAATGRDLADSMKDAMRSW